jgi:hypothetical protein
MRDSIAEDRYGLFVDRATGEVNATKLAEEYAISIDHAEWLGDELHPIWEWALEVADGYAPNARRQSMEDATALLPEVVADAVIGEVESYVGGDGSLRQYADELGDRARAIYGANADFAKKLRRESGRETLYSFMRHWLAALLKKKRPDVFAKLPRGYGWERSHLRLEHTPNAYDSASGPGNYGLTEAEIERAAARIVGDKDLFDEWWEANYAERFVETRDIVAKVSGCPAENIDAPVLHEVQEKVFLKKGIGRHSGDHFATNGENSEYPIWGIPPGKTDEDLLYTRATTMNEAKRVCRILETEHGVTRTRIQVLDLTQPPDFSNVLAKPGRRHRRNAAGLTAPDLRKMRVGDEVTVPCGPAGDDLFIKRTSRDSFFIRIPGHEHARWGTAQQAAEDIEQFVQYGSLPWASGASKF